MITLDTAPISKSEFLPVKTPMNRFEFVFRQVSGGALPSFSGSAWRGALGRALRKQSCRQTPVRCASPSHKCLCVYRRWFEATKVQVDSPFNHAQPRPYVVQPDEVFDVQTDRAPASRPTRQYRLALLVADSAIGDLAAVIEALREAASTGIGRDRARFALLEVYQCMDLMGSSKTMLWTRGKWCEAPKPVAPFVASTSAPREACIEWLTPLRLRQRNRYLFDPQMLNFSIVARALIRRASALNQWYGAGDSDVDFRFLIASADNVCMDNGAVRFAAFTRYSSTQNRKVSMDGLIGRSRVSGNALSAFWPLLVAGQWSHLGKGCTIGLGRYRIYSLIKHSTGK